MIGLGSIGNRHLRNLQQMGVGRLSVVRRPKNNPRFRTPHGVQQFCGIAEAVREQPDFAVICTPSSMHAEQAIKLLEIG
ncbi:MAG: Gfo/Idh/MocA family oxidoreductase, partial [Planctomycetota bacterium]